MCMCVCINVHVYSNLIITDTPGVVPAQVLHRLVTFPITHSRHFVQNSVVQK